MSDSYGICPGTLIAWLSMLRAREHGAANDRAMRRKRRCGRQEGAYADSDSRPKKTLGSGKTR